MSSTPFLDSVAAKHTIGPICPACLHRREVKPGLFGCAAHDKLLLPDFPPTECDDFAQKEESQANAGSLCPNCGRNNYPHRATSSRDAFELEVYKRLAQHGIGNGSCNPEIHKLYAGIRAIDTVLHGKVSNRLRLTEAEHSRLMDLLNKIMPEVE